MVNTLSGFHVVERIGRRNVQRAMMASVPVPAASIYTVITGGAGTKVQMSITTATAKPKRPTHHGSPGSPV
jgi:anthranilate phosphoribosyltransferase